VKSRYGLGLTRATAEEMKLKVGAVTPELAKEAITLAGGQVYGGLFRHLDIALDGAAEFLGRSLSPLFHEIQWLVAECSPEQRADLEATGLTLVGAAAQLRGLPRLMAQRIGLPTALAAEPAHAVARGLGVVMQDVSRLAADGKSYTSGRQS
jgi:rod shape-determining protein MreB